VGFAGLRYGLATLSLLPSALRKKELAAIRLLHQRNWVWLIALGVLYYTIAQGGQYVALAHLPAITVSLVLSLTAIVVVILGMIFLAEFPGRVQWLGIGVFCSGLVFFIRYRSPRVIGLVLLSHWRQVFQPAWDQFWAAISIEKNY